MPTENLGLNYLFPSPVSPPSLLYPQHWPGISSQSTTSIRNVLKHNHENWHIFFNDKHFHNHAAHRGLALWVMGADTEAIEAGYKKDCGYQKPIIQPPAAITLENFTQHLGDEKYYNAYLTFFTKETQQKGISAVLEEFVFSSNANLGPVANAPDEEQPQMLSRFVSGVIHPMIHTGYGTEFGLPGMVVEGLAETAVHAASSTALIPDSIFDISLNGKKADNSDPNALNILVRVQADPRFAKSRDYADTLQKYSAAFVEYAAQWTITPGPHEIEKKIEQLGWMNSLIYGVAGWTGRNKGANEKGHGFNADFFLMHLVTSSVFLPSLLAHIGHDAQIRLLRVYLAASLAWYVSRGRPKLDIEEFMALPIIPFPNGYPGQESPATLVNRKIVSHEASSFRAANPWLAIIQSSIIHPDEHVPKLQRALAHWGRLYGMKGQFSLNEIDLPGAQHLDGTLFLRVALLTEGRMGWVSEGDESADFWDRDGFYGVTRSEDLGGG